MQRLLRYSLIILLALSLQGCPVMIATVTGLFVAAKAKKDKKNADANASDQRELPGQVEKK